MIVQSLEKIPLFYGLQPNDIQLIADRARKRSYAAKIQIVWRGDPGESLYVVTSGKVKVHTATENGSEVTLAVLGPGASFGELSIIDGAPRSADVTTLEPTECVIVEGAVLQQLIEKNPKVAWVMMRHLASMLRASNDSLESLASHDVAGRVAFLLLKLCEQHGKPWAARGSKPSDLKGVIIPVTLTKNDIKSFVGATREHVSNIMNDFTKCGYILTDEPSGHFVVLDSEGLAKRVQ